MLHLEGFLPVKEAVKEAVKESVDVVPDDEIRQTLAEYAPEDSESDFESETESEDDEDDASEPAIASKTLVSIALKPMCQRKKPVNDFFHDNITCFIWITSLNRHATLNIFTQPFKTYSKINEVTIQMLMNRLSN